MLDVVATPEPVVRNSAATALSALTRQALRDARVRTVVFAYAFAAYAYIQPVGFRDTYPTGAARRAFADSFAGNVGLRLLYGHPERIDTTVGYTAWRVGGVLAIAAAAFGLLAAVRAGRAEAESGRTEVVLAAPVARSTSNTAGLLAVAGGIAVLWLAEFAGLAFAGLPLGGSAYLALATSSVAAIFAGFGAVAGVLAPTRRAALGLATAVLGLFFLLRIVADTAAGAGWLRWLTPLGWAELIRPFDDPRPVVLVLPISITALLLVLAYRLGRGLDTGTGLLPSRDRADARMWLLASPTTQALRAQVGVVAAWLVSTAVAMTIFGAVSHSLTGSDVPANVQRQIAKLGSGSIVTPIGYLAFLFLLVDVAICLFVCSQISALHQDEAAELETVLAQPVGRRRWLVGRVALVALVAAAIALVAGLTSWIGAAVVGVHIPLPSLLEAGLNSLPVAVLFLGLGTLAYAVAPRAAAGTAYGLVAVAFSWQLVGALLAAPRWAVDLSPFAHVALVPTKPFQPTAAVVMLAIGMVAVVLALIGIARRDIILRG
ncbi:MAG TPA: hypothetical protein VFU35_15070 [Jatrophihabitans sp.]|nr:hypothetical protein [Jatrophihabitans sp.]